MDDYELQQELEAMAGNAVLTESQDDRTEAEGISTTMTRWQKLFGLEPGDAVERIMEHRFNLTRIRVSDDHWDTVRAEKEAQGYDCEAYEYELEMQKKKALLPDLVPAAGGEADGHVSYLVELTGPLESPEKVQRATDMDMPPTEVAGRSVEERRQVRLCCIDSKAKTALLHWASAQGGGFEPTILVDPKSLQ